MKRSERIKVAAQHEFVSVMDAYLNELGAEPTDEPGRRVLATALGRMHVYPTACERLYTVFCRFDDVERACERLNPACVLGGGMNPFSGKYNFHVWGDCAEAVAAAKRHIKCAL